MVQASGNQAAAATVTLGLTESQLTTALRTYLTGILPAGTEVRLGQENRVPTPLSTFVVMTIIDRWRLYTNSWTYGETTRVVDMPTEFTIQVSAFGAGAGDMIQIVAETWRDMYATEVFTASALPIAPLYAVGPRQAPFITGENQYTPHWNIDLHLQANVLVTVPQDFAASIDADAISVESLSAPAQ